MSRVRSVVFSRNVIRIRNSFHSSDLGMEGISHPSFLDKISKTCCHPPVCGNRADSRSDKATMSGEEESYESDEGSELGFGENERVNTYCSQSQVMEDFSDDEEAIPTAIAPKTTDPESSAKSVGASYTALKKSTATFLASVAVNMFVMDSCAEGEDE